MLTLLFFCARGWRVWRLSPILWNLLWRGEEPVYKVCKRSPSPLRSLGVCMLQTQQFHVYSFFFLPPPGQFLTTQQTCVSKCPGGFFASRLSGVCEACPAGCLQCVDAQHCTRCQSTRKASLFLQSGQCVQQCVRSGASSRLFFITAFEHQATCVRMIHWRARNKMSEDGFFWPWFWHFLLSGYVPLNCDNLETEKIPHPCWRGPWRSISTKITILTFWPWVFDFDFIFYYQLPSSYLASTTWLFGWNISCPL